MAAAVNGDVLRGHLEFLADDALEGRAPGTRGGDLAAKYIAAQFRRLGLEPAGDSGSYYQRVPIISLTPSADARGHRAGRAPAGLEGRLRPLVHAQRCVGERERGEAVFVGYGIVAPEVGWNDYAGLDVKGKIVVALVNDPGLQDSTIFRGKILTYYGRWTYKIEEAQRQGAAGILLVHTTESATYPWTTVLSGWTGPQVRLETPPGLARGRRVAAGGHRRSALQGGRAGSRGAHCRRRPERLQAGAAGRAHSRARCGARSGGPRPRTCWAGCPARRARRRRRC